MQVYTEKKNVVKMWLGDKVRLIIAMPLKELFGVRYSLHRQSTALSISALTINRAELKKIERWISCLYSQNEGNFMLDYGT
jgi:hypothetical protein